MLCQIIKLFSEPGEHEQPRELETEETGAAPKQKWTTEWMGLLERLEMQ